ncbi:transglutaminase superfamily protein [Ilumatobacter fluminis]|uniref:Transglutaminase superfamily protein n=1 Tax=Ilumatobacter fluminis TaxID=467091 RepID=A0A4R7I4E0_9ACTN|nr:transglutaminase domain-containing protein [Ilumatobacter fluminis]TDT18547.1 transglutaminase superfamily protein [Ilumatobacter fluminis]
MALTTLVRSLIAGALGLVLAVLGGTVFDAVLWQVLLVPVVVTAAVIVAARWGTIAVVVAGVASVVVTTAVVPVVSDGSVVDAFPGVWRAPKRLLSTEWPSPSDPAMIAAIALLVGSATAVAVGLATSPRWRLLPLLPIAVAGTVLLALAAPESPDVWLFVVTVVLVIAFIGSVPGQPVLSRRSLVPERTVLATVAVMAVVGIGAATAVAWDDRADPRDTDEPEVSATLLDPIEATVAIRTTEPVRELATISDRSVLARPSMPGRWRLAAFEEYDGQRWVPDIDLRPIGGRLATVPNDAEADVLDYRVQFDSDDLDLLPLPGAAVVVDRDVETDLDRVAVRFIERPGPDTVVDATAVLPPSTAEALAASVVVAPADEIAAAYTDVARTLAGDGADVERLGRLAQEMRFGWELDAAAAGFGQQLALIDRFIVETKRGTAEQFVTAFVLLARSLGYETRIAVGFDVPPDDLGAIFAIRTEHAAVWPEVLLDDGQWLPFDPVPDSQATDVDDDEPLPAQQTPAAAQPPAAEPVESDDEIEETGDDDAVSDTGWGTWATWARRVGTVSAVVLLPIVVIVGGILLLKLRRRRERLRAADPAARVRGAWANTTDSLVDAGLTIGPSWTDDRIADSSSAVVAGVPHETRRLAAMSSAVTFGTRPNEEAARLADDAARTASAIDAAIRASRTRWERLRWRLSLRSLRRATRSPVT